MYILPTRSFDFTGVPSNIAWGFGFYLIGKGIDYLLKQHPIQFNRKTIWKNYQWSKIFLNLVTFVFLGCLSGFLKKIHISKFDKRLSSFMFSKLSKSFKIFMKIEPKVGMEIVQIVVKSVDQFRVNEITGLDKEPDLSDIDSAK